MKIDKHKLQNSKITKVAKFILTSAPFALLLSIAFFWYEMYENDKENDKMISELKNIEQSLSTRYIGIFPNYLPQINQLLLNANPEKPIIIFEDVLYYGIVSTPNEFKKMINHLLELSKECKITIVYYDTNQRIYRRYIRESKINPQFYTEIANETTKLRQQYQHRQFPKGQNAYSFADSIVSEKYFALSKDQNFEKTIKKYLTPLYNPATDRDSLFWRIDQAKTAPIKKPMDKITFYDYLSMYRGITKELENAFRQHNIELIPINEYLVMSCWYNDNKAVLAFPSKYSTDEIGFYSQDHIFAKYIEKMLDGVKNQVREN
ncbi:MAG: hypothetical protein LBN27_08050 [Prevotellaceae bacterium]|jgi:hypothetical protein|nr:hypothetical protein [Prevotellaceae bacterium]